MIFLHASLTFKRLGRIYLQTINLELFINIYWRNKTWRKYRVLTFAGLIKSWGNCRVQTQPASDGCKNQKLSLSPR